MFLSKKDYNKMFTTEKKERKSSINCFRNTTKVIKTINGGGQYLKITCRFSLNSAVWKYTTIMPSPKIQFLLTFLKPTGRRLYGSTAP